MLIFPHSALSQVPAGGRGSKGGEGMVRQLEAELEASPALSNLAADQVNSTFQGTIPTKNRKK